MDRSLRTRYYLSPFSDVVLYDIGRSVCAVAFASFVVKSQDRYKPTLLASCSCGLFRFSDGITLGLWNSSATKLRQLQLKFEKMLCNTAFFPNLEKHAHAVSLETIKIVV